MSHPQSRSIWAMIIKNFINSLKPRQFRGTLVGTDYFGNQYYEIPADPSVGKTRYSRWFNPPKKDDFMQELPAEWESWLRGRRKIPPTDEEIMKNVAIVQMKKKNAIKVNAEAGQITPMTKGFESFPKRYDYESVPGKGNYSS
ncbi:NADH dehydrogenase [ubiquinone] 1 alpha subcomplex assembly factor 2-like [Diorhabda sublineata]|uniref:NADH dehydrogenase [ubiquinone] 1 alpha subcomplex assembly factor 2-like n=1 Tax=Diorhabda sublineata TaxID=1163346 RepID=UPI0024E15309|nr:NADH dehydrogenase [ubiquinone] 1 alpha subcomplex assembly factor 2-like [Diorhabda sublineata]